MALPKQIKRLDISQTPEIKIETPMPDAVIGALTAILQEMYTDYRNFNAASGSVRTKLIIEGSTNTVELNGVIKSVNAQQQPYGDMNVDFGYGGVKGYGYNAMRCTTDVTLELIMDYAEAYETAPKINTTKQEEVTMFSKHVISDVTVGEINPITLELAIKKLAANNNSFQLIEKKDVTYLIVDGADPIELDGDRFKELVSEALVGKTIEEVKSNSNLARLIQNLNVVESITLTKKAVNLSDIIK